MKEREITDKEFLQGLEKRIAKGIKQTPKMAKEIQRAKSGRAILADMVTGHGVLPTPTKIPRF